jgi:hypothetical protein
MVCFDTNFQITRYTSIGDMLEAYFEPRLGAYEARRQHEIKRLKAEMVEADSKARFIKAVLTGTMELRRASDEEIVNAMKKHSLPALTNPAEPQAVESYEYLLRMRMDRVKASAVAEQENAVARAQASLEELEATTASDLWLKDLSAFELSWQKLLQGRGDEKKTGVVFSGKKQMVKKPLK